MFFYTTGLKSAYPIMREKPGHFDNVKEEAIAKARELGITDPDALERIGNHAKNAKIEKVGNASEKRYQKYISKYKRVKTRPATPLEDVYDGIDFWETYHESLKLVDLPVQIKSGPGDVKAFREDKRYKKRDGIFLVFNCGPSVKQADFDEQHVSEIARVREILKAHNVHIF